jgi:hypothetical protein
MNVVDVLIFASDSRDIGHSKYFFLSLDRVKLISITTKIDEISEGNRPVRTLWANSGTVFQLQTHDKNHRF